MSFAGVEEDDAKIKFFNTFNINAQEKLFYDC